MGLGSPKLVFGRDWGSLRPEENSEPEQASEDDQEVIDTLKPLSFGETSTTRERLGLNPLVDRVSGLPSPPGTESDIAQPSAKSKAVSENRVRGLANDAKLSLTVTRLQLSPVRQTDIPSAAHGRSPPNFCVDSSTRSSRHVSNRSPSAYSSYARQNVESPQLRAQLLRHRDSSSEVSSSSLPSAEMGDQRSDGELDTNVDPRRSYAGSVRQNSDTGSNGSPNSRSQEEEASPREVVETGQESSHRHSHTSPSVRRSPSRWSAKIRNGNPDETVVEPPLDELDERIRVAEEQVQRTYSRQSRAYVDLGAKTTPARDTVRRQQLNGRPAMSTLKANGSTMRRSATVSSMSGRTRNGDEAYDHQRSEMNGDNDDMDGSGESGGIGRKWPLPTDYRHRGPVRPSIPTLARLT